MPERILFVSQYAWPHIGHDVVYRQAKALKDHCRLDVSILTWPSGNDGWAGPFPKFDGKNDYACLNQDFAGINYYVIALNRVFSERVPKTDEWERAVNIGCALLERAKPSLVHLQDAWGLWWMLAAAQRLSIPTVYTAHDWGGACFRTNLVQGDGRLCDGVVETQKCNACIFEGRSALGKINETIAALGIGERVLDRIDQATGRRLSAEHGVMRLGLKRRTPLYLGRATQALSHLDALIVPNKFGTTFFGQFGIPQNRMHVVPWFYDLDTPESAEGPKGERTVFGYLGRISAEKGVESLFRALTSGRIKAPLHLVLAGKTDQPFSKKLKARYRERAGIHSVEWLGAITRAEIPDFFEKINATIIPSQCMDNSPLVLTESLAFRRPVIAADLPTLADFQIDVKIGYTFEPGSVESLADSIHKANSDRERLVSFRRNIPPVNTSKAYAGFVEKIYGSIFNVLHEARHV